MSKAATRLVSVLILLVWTSPSAGALALGLHLALEDHGPHGAAGHTLELADLVRTASHGHHHDEASAPDHDHDATIDGSLSSPRPNASWLAVLPTSTSAEALDEKLLLGAPPRRGPPVALFTTHCSLLL